MLPAIQNRQRVEQHSAQLSGPEMPGIPSPGSLRLVVTHWISDDCFDAAPLLNQPLGLGIHFPSVRLV